MANQRTSCNGVRCVCVCSSGSNDRHRKWADAIWTVAFHIAAFYSGGMFEGWDFFLDSHAFFSPNHQIGEGFVYACVWYIRGFSDLMWFFFFSFFPLWKSHNLSVCDVWLCTLISIIPWCTVCFLRWSFRKLFKYYICLWTWQFTTFLSLFISPLCDMCVRARVCIPNVLIEYLYFVNTVLS